MILNKFNALEDNTFRIKKIKRIKLHFLNMIRKYGKRIMRKNNKICKNMSNSSLLKQQSIFQTDANKLESQIVTNTSSSQINQELNNQFFNSNQFLPSNILQFRQQLVLFIRTRASIIELNRQGCQLVVFYMDKYYKLFQYKSEEQIIVLGVFFILSSKMTDRAILSNSSMAEKTKLTCQQFNEWEKKIIKAFQYKVMTHTYVQDVCEYLHKWDKISILKFYEETEESYFRNRMIFYLFDSLTLKNRYISKSMIRGLMKMTLCQQLTTQQVNQQLNKIFPQIKQGKMSNQVQLKLIQFQNKKSQIIKDFMLRQKADNYNTFVNFYK